MIKVIVGLKKRPHADLGNMLRQLKSYALTFPGISKIECIEMLPENNIIALLYEWETIENWKCWEMSKLRKRILDSSNHLLLDKPQTKVYRDTPINGWAYTSTTALELTLAPNQISIGR